MRPAKRNSLTFREGLTMVAAKDCGIDPELAAEAGDTATACLNAIRRARKAKTPSQRAEHVRAAQDELRRISPRQHPELVSAIQAKLLALQGRGGDTEIAHVTPGEVVIPRNLQTPAVMRTLAAEAARAGIDPRRYTVGHRANSVNPRTGKPEFLPTVEGPPYTYTPWPFTFWRPGLSGTGGGSGIGFVQFPDDGSTFAGAIQDQLATNLNRAVEQAKPAQESEIKNGIRDWSKDELTAAKKWLEERRFEANAGIVAAVTGGALLGVTALFTVGGATLFVVGGLAYILGMTAASLGIISFSVDHFITLIDQEIQSRP